MAHVKANGIQIEYETFGKNTDPAIVLIAGNGAQLNFWEPDFCEMLVKENLQVIRFDNRDAGLSTKFDDAGIPDMKKIYQAAQEGKPIKTAYTLEDMADDVAGLLDVLKIKKAHICGASMGGTIAQVFAYKHPSRTCSLISIMSSTGNPNNPQISPETLAIVTATPPNEREAYIDYSLQMWAKIWSKGFPFEPERARRYCEESYDRCYYPQGAIRQNAALIANGDRRQYLSELTIPALVVHGTADVLFPVEAGKDTARTIPNAKLLLIEGMGHDMPKGTWKSIVEAIARQANGISHLC
ncbi:alpha/beta fold hydrolase [Fusibacter ferrireducens]|uniref:Alpha/beta hydrolase n=1 Tax=Fusibacter ferrireducens TaxID=2785058 RepID=A0ABR9ZNZ9_9FIRM|nr:alpha/beta hydrolase [Fusibacter ferrireducens]MBF4692171.1 alpha/beta hydrolase [Fusibacter ferrireducens]